VSSLPILRRVPSNIHQDDTIALATEAPVVDIPEQAVEFENLGTTIEVIVNGTTSFAGTDFRLKQFHVHTPSEHRLGDEYFPLELHFVHEGVSKLFPFFRFPRSFPIADGIYALVASNAWNNHAAPMTLDPANRKSGGQKSLTCRSGNLVG
jgi:hypothetical protein